MRGKVLILLAVVLTVSLWAFAALPQDEEPKAQLFFVTEEVVKPSIVGKYEALAKEYVAKCIKHKSPYPFYTFSTDDFHYYWAFPVKNFADIDNLFKAGAEMVEKEGIEQWQEMMVKFGQTLYSYHRFVVRYMPQQSYIPSNPRLKPEESKFCYWTFIYVHFAKEIEFEKLCQEWVDLYKSKNIADGWSIYVGDIGTDLPIYVFHESGKNAADYFRQSEENQKLLGEEAKALSKKTLSLIRKLEIKTGWSRPDLSYTPKKEKDTE